MNKTAESTLHLKSEEMCPNDGVHPHRTVPDRCRPKTKHGIILDCKSIFIYNNPPCNILHDILRLLLESSLDKSSTECIKIIQHKPDKPTDH